MLLKYTYIKKYLKKSRALPTSVNLARLESCLASNISLALPNSNTSSRADGIAYRTHGHIRYPWKWLRT